MARKKQDNQEATGDEAKISEAVLKKALPKGFTLGKTAASRADLFMEVNKFRLAEEKKLDSVREFESLLRRWFIQELPASDSSGVAGKVARVQIIRKDIPKVESWDKFEKYIKKTGQTDLLMKPQASIPAIKARWEEGKKIPGVGVFQAKTVSLTQAKTKK
jgi:hypothetical protein